MKAAAAVTERLESHLRTEKIEGPSRPAAHRDWPPSVGRCETVTHPPGSRSLVHPQPRIAACLSQFPGLASSTGCCSKTCQPCPHAGLHGLPQAFSGCQAQARKGGGLWKVLVARQGFATIASDETDSRCRSMQLTFAAYMFALKNQFIVKVASRKIRCTWCHQHQRRVDLKVAPTKELTRS